MQTIEEIIETHSIEQIFREIKVLNITPSPDDGHTTDTDKIYNLPN